RILSVVFLVTLGIATAEAAQITGALLVFALLVVPAASAQALTSRPSLGFALSILLGVLITWTGLGIAYYSPYPVGFWLTALAFGGDARVGVFVGCIAAAIGLGVLGERGRSDDVVIGSVFTWILGLGVLFLSIYTTSNATGNSAANAHALFGSIFGLGRADARVAAAVAVAVVVALLAIARPLLFASVDERV